MDPQEATIVIPDQGEVTPDPASSNVEGLSRGGKAGRKSIARYRLICPACGAGPFLPHLVQRHLRSKQCLKVHSKDEAAELAKTAPRDPKPFQEAVDFADKLIAHWEKRRDEHEDEYMVRNINKTLKTMRLQYERLLRMGPEEFVPGPGYYDQKREPTDR